MPFSVTRVSTDASGTSITFSENDAGDALVTWFASTATTNDFTALPTTLTDSANNTWNLIYTNIGANNVVGFNCVALYIVNRCVSAFTNVLDMPAEMMPADVLVTWCNAIELTSGFATLTFETVAYATGETADFPLTGGLLTPGTSLLLGALYDAATVGQPTIDADPVWSWQPQVAYGPYAANEEYFFGQIEFYAPSEFTLTDSVSVNAALDTFGFMLGVTGQNATGASSQAAFTINMFKGPKIEPPTPHRLIAGVTIDATAMVVKPIASNPLNFPELKYSSGSENLSIASWGSTELDLEHIGNSGMDQVRKLYAYYRPGWGYDSGSSQVDDGGTNIDQSNPAFLTNISTGQTVILGNSPGDTSCEGMVNMLMCPFFCMKGAMKLRFIVTSINDEALFGIYRLIFTNFTEEGTMFASIGFPQ